MRHRTLTAVAEVAQDMIFGERGRSKLQSFTLKDSCN